MIDILLNCPPEGLRAAQKVPVVPTRENLKGFAAEYYNDSAAIPPHKEQLKTAPALAGENVKSYEDLSREAYSCKRLAKVADNGGAGGVLSNGYTIEKVVSFGHLGGKIGRALGIGGGGAMAFLLKPPQDSKKPAIVLYHGTSDIPATIIDIDPRGMGRSLLNWSGNGINSEIAEWMEQNAEHGIITTGHSLGGALANMTAIYAPKKVAVTSISFAAPGLNKDAYRDWEKKNALNRRVISFENEKDELAQAGWRKVGEVYNRPVPEGKKRNLAIHNSRLFGDGTSLFEENPESIEEAKKTSQEWSEKRAKINSFRWWSSALHRFSATILSPIAVAGVALKRFLVGSEHNYAPMRWGILGLPVLGPYELYKRATAKT